MDYSKFLIDDSNLVDWVIYKFKNKINGKIYIGQTTKSLKRRVIQHVTNSKTTTKVHKTYFHNALNKYGIESFELLIIERCATREELNDREIYWITYYNSNCKEFGYNIESGGQYGNTTKSLSIEHKLALLNANLGKHRSRYTKEQLSITHKNLWKDEDFKAIHIKNILKVLGWNKKKVYQYDASEKFIKEWSSILDVALILYGNKRRGNMTRDIKNHIKNKLLGFMKNGSIWSTISPTERSNY